VKRLQSIDVPYLNFLLQISECMEIQAEVAHLKEQLSQALEAKDLLSNSIIQNNIEINNEIEHHAGQEKAVQSDPSETSQKQQQVCFLCSCCLASTIFTIEFKDMFETDNNLDGKLNLDADSH
jgi:hypothetical protein